MNREALEALDKESLFRRVLAHVTVRVHGITLLLGVRHVAKFAVPSYGLKN